MTGGAPLGRVCEDVQKGRFSLAERQKIPYNEGQEDPKQMRGIPMLYRASLTALLALALSVGLTACSSNPPRSRSPRSPSLPFPWWRR